MLVFKYIVLGIIVCLTLYLIVDTTIWVVKKIKQKKKDKTDKVENQDKTE